MRHETKTKTETTTTLTLSGAQIESILTDYIEAASGILGGTASIEVSYPYDGWLDPGHDEIRFVYTHKEVSEK